jgi:hypothetical protein
MICYFPMFYDTIFTEIEYFINQPTANTVVVHTPQPVHPYTVQASNQCYGHPPDDAIPLSPRDGGGGSVVHAVLESVVPDLIVMRLSSPVVVGAFGYQHMQSTGLQGWRRVAGRPSSFWVVLALVILPCHPAVAVCRGGGAVVVVGLCFSSYGCPS